MNRLFLTLVLLFTGTAYAQFDYTPLGTGTTPVLPLAATPTASVAAGAVASGTVVTLSAVTAGSIIRYSTTGTVTCSTGTVGSAITITAPLTISAINCPVSGYQQSLLFTAAYTITSSGQGWTGPQTQPLSAMSTGPNGYMNGFLPFCPSPTHCSVIYKDISAEPVDTPNDGYFKAYSNYATASIAPNGDSANTTLPWFTVKPSVDSSLTFVAGHSTDIPTQSDDTVIPLKCGSMYTEGGGDPCAQWTGDSRDRHLDIINADTGKMNSTYQAETKNGVVDWYSNTIWNLMLPIEEQNTGGYTSADAAGLPQLAMDITYEDLAAGEIKHVLRGTVPHTSIGFYAGGDQYGLWASPASHAAGGGGGTRAAYMGEWLRLKASVPVPSSCGPQGTVIVNALKKHGWMVTDNGNFGLLQMTYDSRIDQSDVACISSLTGNNFEVIQVQGAKVVAGELNPETLTAGVTTKFDQTGLYDSTTQGTAIANNPAAPTATCSVSPTTTAVGTAVTFTVTATNADRSFIDKAHGVIDGATGGTLSYTPSQTDTYTAKVRGRNGYAFASCGTVTLTGSTVATPTFSPAPGNYTSAQSVTLASATSGANLAYTLDSSTPSCYSTAYTGPISVSTPKTIKAIACKSGMLNSAVVSGFYSVNVPGATPAVTGSSNSGGLNDATSRSASYTFNGGTSALITTNYTNTTSLPSSVVCGTTSATLISSKTGTSTPQYTAAAYLIQSQPSGVASCTITWPVSVYATMAVTEVAGSTGLDTNQSNGNTTAYPSIMCGSLATTGTNRLLFALGQTPNSYVSGVSPYTQVYAAGNSALETLSMPSAATQTVTVNTHDDSTGATCIAFALKPTTGGLPTAAAPTFSPSGGTFTTTPYTVTPSTTSSGAVTHTTIDGSTPTCSSATGAVSLTSTATVQSIACGSGFNNSSVSSATYTYSAPATLPTTNLLLRFEAPTAGTFTTWPAGTGTTITAAMAQTMTSAADSSLPIAGNSVNVDGLTGSIRGTLSSTIAATQTFTVYAVTKSSNASPGGFNILLGGGSGALFFSPAHSAHQTLGKNGCCFYDPGSSTTSTTSWTDTRATYNYSTTTGTYSYLRNGASDGSSTSTDYPTAVMDSILSDSTGGNPLNGKVAAIIVYTGVPDSATETQIESYISQKYGTH